MFTNNGDMTPKGFIYVIFIAAIFVFTTVQTSKLINLYIDNNTISCEEIQQKQDQ